MRKVATLIKTGYSHFGSGSVNSHEFNIFFSLFKKSFTIELNMINAENIVFSKGHFYLSGFFTVQNQIFYFSLSDVRSSQQNPQLLVRTAKNYQDFSGGANNYVSLKKDIGWQMLFIFGLDLSYCEENSKKVSIQEKCYAVSRKMFAELQSDNYSKRTVTTGNQAFWTMVGIMKLMGFNAPVNERKINRKLTSLTYTGNEVKMFYNYEKKELTVNN